MPNSHSIILLINHLVKESWDNFYLESEDVMKENAIQNLNQSEDFQFDKFPGMSQLFSRYIFTVIVGSTSETCYLLLS